MKSKSYNALILKLIEDLQKVRILKDSILIIGAGKFGKIALKYALNNKISRILIIDNDPITEIIEAHVVSSDINEIENLVKQISELSATNQDNTDSKVFFFKTDLNVILLIFSLFIPEKVVPAVPYHVFGYYLKMMLNKTISINIKQEKFEKVLKSIPQEVIFNSNCSQGIISLSYTKASELCPDDCIGPPDYCPNFDRIKPKTITEIVNSIEFRNILKITIESEQLGAGLGSLSGKRIKNGLNEFYRRLNQITINQKEVLKDLLIVVATTCNCHGILNLFELNCK